jgi:antigen flippase
LVAEEAALTTADASSWRILKSTVIIGGSNFVVAIVRLVQMKVFAVALGPSGVGLLGLYQSVMSTSATIGGLGLSNSGVRQVSEATSSPAGQSTATALFTLRRLTLAVALLSAGGVFLLRRSISAWVFGTEQHAGAVAVLSVGVLFTIISSSQLAVLNGLCRVNDIARANIVGTGIGVLVAVLLVLRLGDQALEYVIVSTALIMLIAGWSFARRIPSRGTPSYAEIGAQSVSLIRLGVAFMAAGLLTSAAVLLARVIVLDRLGMVSAGHFQAAWGFSVFYVEFILNAMAVDFYPHLTSRIRDRKAAHRLVNEQIEVALLLGGPLILGMVLLAPILIRLFYSTEFGAATELLRWLLLGSILKIVAWPMGYLIMARARVKTFLFAEAVWASAYLGLLYVTAPYAGITGAGYAFVGSYMVYVSTLYLITRWQDDFAWTRMNLRLAGTVSLAGLLVMALALQGGTAAYLASALITLGIGMFSLRRLRNIVGHTNPAWALNLMPKSLTG